MDQAFGYNAAVDALLRAVAPALTGRCLHRALVVDDEGFIPCTVLEVTRADSGVPPCAERPGRQSVADGSNLARGARQYLEDSRLCGSGTEVDCENFELCEIVQLTGDARASCLTDIVESDTGFCYIDPLPEPAGQAIGSETLVDRCPDEQKRLLRFVGDNTPVSGSISIIQCTSALE
jgi:hypothetical protein